MRVETIKAELRTQISRLIDYLGSGKVLDGDEEEVNLKKAHLQEFLWWIERREGTIEDLMEDAEILQDFGQIRQNIVEGLNRFVLLHQPVGHFLTAVLSNNLREAFARADADNQKTMFQIVSYCHNQIPGNCWGTPEKVKAWVEMDPKDFPNVEAPTETKEQDRQNREVIWGITKFKIEKRLSDLEKEGGGS